MAWLYLSILCAVGCKDEAAKEEDFVGAVEPRKAGLDGTRSAIGWLKGWNAHEPLDPDLVVWMNVTRPG